MTQQMPDPTYTRKDCSVFYWVFIRPAGYQGQRGTEALILPEDKLSGALRWRLERDEGWELLWDSAPSHAVAAERAADGSLVDADGQPVMAFARPCTLCGQHVETVKVRALRWIGDSCGRHRNHVMPFCGYVCWQCAETNDTLERVVYVATGQRASSSPR